MGSGPELTDWAHPSERRGSLPTAGGDFRLETQHVAIPDFAGQESLIVGQLPSSAFVVEFVAHQLAVGTVPGKVHAVDQDGNDAIDRRVHGHLYRLFLITGRIPDFDGDGVHGTQGSSSAAVARRQQPGNGFAARKALDLTSLL